MTKIKREQKVAITAPVKWIQIPLKKLRKAKYQKYNFVSYLFPSTKMKVELNPEYKAKDGARLKVLEAVGIVSKKKQE